MATVVDVHLWLGSDRYCWWTLLQVLAAYGQQQDIGHPVGREAKVGFSKYFACVAQERRHLVLDTDNNAHSVIWDDAQFVGDSLVDLVVASWI